MIAITNTIVDVRTMMIKSLHTKVADVTMPTSRSSYYFAFRTHI
jgi:hypothetical protein